MSRKNSLNFTHEFENKPTLIFQTTIIIRNIPAALNDKDALKIRFQQYGRILRLYHNSEKKAASVAYYDHVCELCFYPYFISNLHN